MDFSFDNVQYLYDTYGNNKENDKFFIVARKSKIKYDFKSEFAQYVKFAHAWVQATKYNRSTTYPTTTQKTITEEEYANAFNDFSKQTYNTILCTIVQSIQSFGRMYKIEALEKELKDSIVYTHATDIVKGLYSNTNYYNSLENWCKKASTLYTEEQLREIIQKGVSR